MAQPRAIISPKYCLPYPVDLACTRKVMSLTDGGFLVTDVNDAVIFKVKEKLFSFKDKRTLLDGAGNSLVTVTQKVWSLRRRHSVYRGTSTEEKDLICTVKQSKMFQWKTTLDVFLASNTTMDVPDFRVKGSWFERSCVIYAGKSKNIVAQMHKKRTIQSVFLGKDKFMVTVYANIDYAFIISLIVVLDDINRDGQQQSAGST
jgi:uncharacterized protein YxjI